MRLLNAVSVACGLAVLGVRQSADAAVAAHAAMYSSSSAVISANTYSFKSVVMDTEHAAIVEFYAPWCGHCQKLAPEYNVAASKLQGLAKVVAVDCDDNMNKELCGRFGIQGFPTLKVFSGGPKGMPEDYNGERTAKAIVDYMIPKITAKHVRQIGAEGKKSVSIESFVGDGAGKMPRALFVSNKAITPPLYKALSVEYKGRLAFAEAKGPNAKYAERLTTKVPSILVWPKDATFDDKPIEYEGTLKQKPLKEFFDKHALAAKEAKPAKKDKKDKKPADKAKPNSTSEKQLKTEVPTAEEPFDPSIPELKTQEDLQTLCLDRPGVCVISFATLEPSFPESVAAHNATLSIVEDVKLAFHKRKNSPFTFVWVNAVETGRKLQRDFDVSDSYPNMLAINTKKKAFRPLRGAFDQESIVAFLGDIMAGKGRSFAFTFSPQLDMAKKASAAKSEPAGRDEL